MAALDFPAAPTAGQVVTLTNGFSYQWDGAVWTLSPATVGQVAGGDLTGTYPNPTIANGAVTQVKLAAGVTVQKSNMLALTGPLIVAAAVTTIMTVQIQSYRGGHILILLDLWGVVTPKDTALAKLNVGLVLDGATVLEDRVLQGAGTSTMINGALPFGVSLHQLAFVAAPAADHIVTVRTAIPAGTGIWQLDSGRLVVVGLI
jgi:hypothetical protein